MSGSLNMGCLIAKAKNRVAAYTPSMTPTQRRMFETLGCDERTLLKLAEVFTKCDADGSGAIEIYELLYVSA